MDLSIFPEHLQKAIAKSWREHTLQHLQNYPEFGRFGDDEKYTLIKGSHDSDVRWAAEEVIRLEKELAECKEEIRQLRNSNRWLDQHQIDEL